jgi:flagellin
VFQAGINSGQTISVSIASVDAVNLGVMTAASISTFTGAQASLDLLDSAIDKVNSTRSAIGATMNQLSYSADNMTNISTNIAASRSSIMDTDYATASATLSKSQIVQQAATAMLAQANQQPQSVLSLIK